MAGGTFDKRVGKVRPGTYINFQGDYTENLTGSRGTAVIPLFNHTWGPSGEFIEITSGSPDARKLELGYSVFDMDDNHQMLLIKEALKNAATVLAYRVNTGEKASVTSEGLTATAVYGGTFGNSLKFSVVTNAVSGFDVSIYFGDETLATYEGLTTIAQLAAIDNGYIVFTGSGDLAAVSLTALSGGTDVAATNSNVETFVNALEGVRFDTVAFPNTTASLQAIAIAKIKDLLENAGRYVQIVVPSATTAPNYEGVINVTNSVAVEGIELTIPEVCAWVAGATAGASYTESLTNKQYQGATAVVGPKTNAQAETAINNGEFFFSISEDNAVVVEYDINSLTDFSGKDKSYRKNKVIRIIYSLANDIKLNFPPNKFPNSEDGWGVMEGIGRSLLKIYEDDGAITNVDYDNDFVVDTTLSQGDEVYFNVAIQPVDSAEKLYFTITTR